MGRRATRSLQRRVPESVGLVVVGSRGGVAHAAGEAAGRRPGRERGGGRERRQRGERVARAARRPRRTRQETEEQGTYKTILCLKGYSPTKSTLLHFSSDSSVSATAEPSSEFGEGSLQPYTYI